MTSIHHRYCQYLPLNIDDASNRRGNDHHAFGNTNEAYNGTKCYFVPDRGILAYRDFNQMMISSRIIKQAPTVMNASARLKMAKEKTPSMWNEM